MTNLATLFQDVEECCFRRPTGIVLSETENAYVLEALVAGVKAKDLNISFEKGNVTIQGQTGNYSCSYLFPLPADQIDDSAAPEAISEDGILKITFPKAKATRPLKITVKSV